MTHHQQGRKFIAESVGTIEEKRLRYSERKHRGASLDMHGFLEIAFPRFDKCPD